MNVRYKWKPLKEMQDFRNFFDFWPSCELKSITYEFSNVFDCLRIFFIVSFMICSLWENCLETTNELIKIWKSVFTKNMQRMHDGFCWSTWRRSGSELAFHLLGRRVPVLNLTVRTHILAARNCSLHSLKVWNTTEHHNPSIGPPKIQVPASWLGYSKCSNAEILDISNLKQSWRLFWVV